MLQTSNNGKRIAAERKLSAKAPSAMRALLDCIPGVGAPGAGGMSRNGVMLLDAAAFGKAVAAQLGTPLTNAGAMGKEERVGDKCRVCNKEV